MKTRRKKNVSGDHLTITRRITRSKTSEDRRESSSLPIPIDLIVDIFSRLPLKSIAACRCVSKLWASTLRCSDFTDLFLTKSSARPQLLFSELKDGELFFYSRPHPQVPASSIWSHVVANHRRFTFDSFCHIGEIRGHVHGLVCVEHLRVLKRRNEMVVVICNPSTGQSLTLPKLKTARIGVTSLFGYDPIGKQYKVLSLTLTRHKTQVECEEHQVLTLGETSWRKIDSCVPSSFYIDRKICINGVLYYPTINWSTETYSIVCFDVRSEKFSFIKAEEPLRTAVISGTMIDYNGKLGLILGKNHRGYVLTARASKLSRIFLLWVLENPQKQEWSVHIYVLPALWMNIVGEGLLRFAGVTRTNELVLSSDLPCRPEGFHLVYFSLERNTVVRVDFQGIDASNYHLCLDHVEDVKLYAASV